MRGVTIRRLAIKAIYRICPRRGTGPLIVCSRFGGRVLWKFWFLRVSILFFRLRLFVVLRNYIDSGFFQFYSCVPACMCVCVHAILYVGTLVRACVCTYASRDERLGSLNNMFFLTRLFFNQFSVKVEPKHPNYSDESAPPSLIHNLGTLRIIQLVFLFIITAFVATCTLLQHPTSYANPTSPTPCQRKLVC